MNVSLPKADSGSISWFLTADTYNSAIKTWPDVFCVRCQGWKEELTFQVEENFAKRLDDMAHKVV